MQKILFSLVSTVLLTTTALAQQNATAFEPGCLSVAQTKECPGINLFVPKIAGKLETEVQLNQFFGQTVSNFTQVFDNTCGRPFPYFQKHRDLPCLGATNALIIAAMKIASQPNATAFDEKQCRSPPKDIVLCRSSCQGLVAAMSKEFGQSCEASNAAAFNAQLKTIDCQNNPIDNCRTLTFVLNQNNDATTAGTGITWLAALSTATAFLLL